MPERFPAASAIRGSSICWCRRKRIPRNASIPCPCLCRGRSHEPRSRKTRGRARRRCALGGGEEDDQAVEEAVREIDRRKQKRSKAKRRSPAKTETTGARTLIAGARANAHVAAAFGHRSPGAT